MADPNPYAAPAAATATYAGMDGYGLGVRTNTGIEIPKTAELPECCVKCGRTNDLLRWQRTFVWCPQWVYIFLLANVLILLIVYMFVRKVAKLSLPICVDCRSRWRRETALWGFTIFGAIIGSVGGIILLLTEDRALKLLGPVVLLAVIVAPILVYRRMRRAILWAPLITRETVTLAGLHPDMEGKLIGMG